MRRILVVILSAFISTCTPKQSEQSNSGYASLEDVKTNYKEVVCFVYHRFGDNRFPSTNIPLKDFQAHLNWLADHHYQVLNLSDAIDYLSNNTPAKKTAVISIDDGYKSFFENGLPLLRQHNFPATLFINTETVGAGDYMDWKQLEEAIKQKIEIGNHTHTHAYFLNKESSQRYADFEDDIKTAQQLITKKLGITSKVFAYPYGEFDKEMKAIVKANGFIGAAAQNSGVMNNISDKYQIPRFPMSENYAKMFDEKASMQSIRIIKKSPESNLIPSDTNQPLLALTIDTEGLLVDQLQCFVQGGNCKINIINSTDRQMELTLQSTNDITHRRRTLYTLTAPDSAGNWHWFSHLWINPSVK